LSFKVGDNYHILDDDRPQSGNFKPANRVCYKHEAVTVSNVHRKGARESSAAIDPPMKGLDPGFILVGSVKDGHGRLGGLSVFYLQELKRAIRSGGRIQREVAIGLGAQLWGVAEEGGQLNSGWIQPILDSSLEAAVIPNAGTHNASLSYREGNEL
jgi:hypothetical protein